MTIRERDAWTTGGRNLRIVDGASRAWCCTANGHHAYGGLRLGEMLALRPERIDLLRGRVEVLSTLVEVNGRLLENAPKTRAGRTVPIPRVVVDALRDHLASVESGAFVFSGRGGRGGTDTSVRRDHRDRLAGWARDGARRVTGVAATSSR